MPRLSYNVFFRDGVIEKVLYFESRGLDLYVEIWDGLEDDEIHALQEFGIRPLSGSPAIKSDCLLIPIQQFTRIEVGRTLE
jgi:hypothetical protein